MRAKVKQRDAPVVLVSSGAGVIECPGGSAELATPVHYVYFGIRKAGPESLHFVGFYRQ
jgi:hypothetical protein